jgi:hypothetical protein
VIGRTRLEYTLGNTRAAKKGIPLTLGRWKIWAESTEAIDEALSKCSAYSLHLVGNVYCTVSELGVCVDIRQYWSPPDHDGVVPTKRGICPRPGEYTKLKEAMSSIGECVPELNGVVPCYLQSNHQNQLGYLQCAECSPNCI